MKVQDRLKYSNGVVILYSLRDLGTVEMKQSSWYCDDQEDWINQLVVDSKVKKERIV